MARRERGDRRPGQGTGTHRPRARPPEVPSHPDLITSARYARRYAGVCPDVRAPVEGPPRPGGTRVGLRSARTHTRAELHGRAQTQVGGSPRREHTGNSRREDRFRSTYLDPPQTLPHRLKTSTRPCLQARRAGPERSPLWTHRPTHGSMATWTTHLVCPTWGYPESWVFEFPGLEPRTCSKCV